MCFRFDHFFLLIMAASCVTCSINYFDSIGKFIRNDKESINFLCDHSVLPKEVKCGKCGNQCIYYDDRRLWRCSRMYRMPKTKKRRCCDFSVSENKGSFLDKTHIPPWKIMLFVTHFLSHSWDHRTILSCLKFSIKTSVDWRSFCSEVTDRWLTNQEPIGGDGVRVEIDETYLTQRKYHRGRFPNKIWLFGE